MPNILRISVADPDELLNAGAYGAGAIVRIQGGAAALGPFADVAGAGATPTVPIAAGVDSYTGFDPSGTSATWYRTRYESADASRASDWAAAFQVGGASGIVGLADVRNRLEIDPDDTDSDALLLGFIGDFTKAIERYCGRWFLPRPASGDTTYLFSPKRTGVSLPIERGIRSLTSIGYSTIDQPDTGGSYIVIDPSTISLQPSEAERDPGWPALEVTILNTQALLFYAGVNRVQVTGQFGFASVPEDVAGVAMDAIVRRHVGKASGVMQVVGSQALGGQTVLRWISPEGREVLDAYRDRLI